MRLAIAALLACAATAGADARLPRTFAPTGYRATLAIDATTKLAGHIEIDGTLAAPSRSVWLDAVGITVTAATARGASGEVVLAPTLAHGRLTLSAPAPLPAGAWTIAIDYAAKLDDEGAVVLPPDGEKRDPIPEQLAAARVTAAGVFRQTVDGAAYTFTQSEPMDARRIFPCLDEPDRKVPWQLTLDVDTAVTAASNAPIAKETPLGQGRKRVEFAPTQPLPSYLIAFAVGPFDAIDAGRTASGVALRILETHGHTAPWAAATAGKLLEQIEAWTGIPYAYPKLDLVAVPRTGLHWAAMENPGLVTFADWVIRGDGGREAKKTWVSIASHELAHQWFGDLVTMAWWDDIWLNESFAVWLAREMTAQFDRSYAEPLDRAYVDIVETARPPAGKASYLDYFVGGRGARALAMFAELLGAEKFRAAIHAYLAAHVHANATTADLATALSAAYGAPLGDWLVGALDTAAVPQVTVASSCSAIELTASQPTPVCVAYEQAGKRATACRLVAAKASIPVAACPRWVVPNADGAMRYTSPRAPDQLAATARDWALLSVPERSHLLDELGPDLDLALRLWDAPDARAWAAETIARAARLAPDRGKLEALVAKRYVARARKLHLDPADREDAAILAVASLVHDPELEREAVLAIPNLRAVRTDALGAVVRLALRADPGLESTILAELDRAFFERRRALLHALPVDLVARAASVPMLTVGDQLVLLADSCEPARRAEAQRLASSLSEGAMPVLRDFNACLDTRERAQAAWRRALP